MSGHREDGTFAEDKAHHPNRKVGKQDLGDVLYSTMSPDMVRKLASGIRQDGASPQDFLKHGPACDYCGAESGQPCKDGCANK